MKKKKEIDNNSEQVLNKNYYKKLAEAQEKFISGNKVFFNFFEKFPPKGFQECINKYFAQSYLEFLKDYDKKLYEKFITDESRGDYYHFNNNPFDGWSPENIQTFTKSIERSILFEGKGGRLTKEKIILYTKTFEKYDEQILLGSKPKWSEVFSWACKYKNEQGDPLVSDDIDRKKQYKAFLKFRKENNLNSVKDFKKYLSLK